MRLIDADKLGKVLCSVDAEGETIVALSDVRKALAQAVEEDAAPIVRAHWKIETDEFDICASVFTCSNCKTDFCTMETDDAQTLEMLKYCPHCGAKMEEK